MTTQQDTAVRDPVKTVHSKASVLMQGIGDWPELEIPHCAQLLGTSTPQGATALYLDKCTSAAAPHSRSSAGCTQAKPMPRSHSLLQAHWGGEESRREPPSLPRTLCTRAPQLSVSLRSLSSRAVMTAFMAPKGPLDTPMELRSPYFSPFQDPAGENPTQRYSSKGEDSWFRGSETKNKWR